MPTAGATNPVQGQRKTKVGRVVSDKMDKTIVVSVERLTRHRLYKRVMKASTKFAAHDERNEAQDRRHRPDRGVPAPLGHQALAPGVRPLPCGRGAGRRGHPRRGGRDERGDPRRRTSRPPCRG